MNFGSSEQLINVAGFLGAGMFLDPSDDSVVSDNSVYDNAGSGIYLLDSDGVTISGNTIPSNGVHGIGLENSDENVITENVIDGNGGSSALFKSLGMTTPNDFLGSGLFLDPSDNNVVTFNNVTNSGQYGVFIEATSNSQVSGNRIINSTLYGINIDFASASSVVNGNNFQGNNEGLGKQGFDEGNGNQFTANYWSDHDSTDANFDGVADNPYELDGTAGTEDANAPNVPNGLNFYTVPNIAEVTPNTINAGSDGTPVTLHIELSDEDGFRAFNITDDDLLSLKLNGTIVAFNSHIIDPLRFTVTFPRAEVNDLLNSLGLTEPFEVTFKMIGRINTGLLEITVTSESVVVNQTGESPAFNDPLLSLSPVLMIPAMKLRSKKEK